MSNTNTTTTLLTIEESFLANAQVKQALNLTAIRSAQRTIVNAKKKKFDETLKMSKLVLSAFDWFTSEEGKLAASTQGISWSNEDFANKVFGFQKSYFYKLTRAGKIAEEVVSTFVAKCDEAETQGQDPDRSLAGLLKFAKVVETEAQGNGQGEGEGEGEGAEVETRSATIFTLAFKREAGNVSVRIDERGEVKTTNSAEDIAEAIQFLQDALTSALSK
jgi:hypothetical protein